MIAELNLPHGSVPLPAFFPDGTRGTVKSAAPSDLDACKVTGIVANAYHLMSTPGQSAVKSLGGLNKFINWNRPILTDSGGFQVFSLIGENAKFGEIQDDQIIFRPENSRDKIILTPEKCIRAQFDYGSDVMMCLDYCIHSGAPGELIKKAVEITIKWAKRCRAEYDNIIKTKSKKAKGRPLIFGIIQGAGDKTMRKECADALIGIGFDGFAFGGWPADEQNNLACDILAYTAQLMPDGLVKYAMGVGKPEEIVECCKMGYNLFDCVIPTREARHNRLYIFNEQYASFGDIDVESRDFYGYHYIADDKHRRDSRPVSRVCDCFCCQNHSRAYLRHLAAVGDPLAHRLATVHNLRFYTMLMELIAKKEREKPNIN